MALNGYSEVYQGQGGTGAAALTSDDGSSVNAYKYLQDQDLLKKKQAHDDLSKFSSYVLGGYDKHYPVLANMQQDLYKEVAGEMRKSNGVISPEKMVQFNAKKSYIQGLAKASDQMTSYVKDQVVEYNKLGPDKAEGWDKVKNFIDNASAEEQMQAILYGKVPRVTPKAEVVDWRENANKFKAAMIEREIETDAGDKYITNKSKIVNDKDLRDFSLDYAKSGIFGANKFAKSLLEETAKKIEDDPNFLAISDPKKQQEYLINVAANEFYNFKKKQAETSTGQTIQQKTREKGEWASAGSGSVKRDDFIFTKEDREDWGGKFSEYHMQRTDASPNKAIPLRLDGAKDAKTGEAIIYNPNTQGGKNELSSNALEPISYVVGENGLSFLKAKKPARKIKLDDGELIDDPERVVLIPAQNVDKAVAASFGGADLNTIIKEIEKANGGPATRSLGQSINSHSKSSGGQKTTPSLFSGIQPR